MTVFGPRTRVMNTDNPLISNELMYGTWTAKSKYYGVGDFPPYDIIDLYTVKSEPEQSDQVTEDVVNENFALRRSKGEIFNNPFRSIKRIDSGFPPTEFIFGNVTFPNDWMTGWYYTGMRSCDYLAPSPLNLPTVEAEDLYEQVRDRAVTMAYANRSLVVEALSMVVAEGKKTVQSVYEILFRVAEILLAAKRLDWRYLRSELSPGELRDRYMELRYALRPLAIDLENTVRAVNTDLGRSRKTARGGADAQVIVSDQVVNKINGMYKTSWDRTSLIKYEAKSGILCDVSQTQPSVWGIDQIVEVLWEVTPWSFIAGWFFNIADLISSWTPKCGIRELASWVSIVRTDIQQVNMINFENATDLSDRIHWDTWSGTRNIVTVDKIRLPEPKRGIWPRLDVNLDSLKILDLTIIMQGILSGNVKKLSKKMF